MNTRDCPILHLDSIKFKEQDCYCCSTFHSHSWVFSNVNNQYPKMSVKQHIVFLYITIENNTTSKTLFYFNTNEVQKLKWFDFDWIMAINVTFNNISFISWRSVLLVEETAVPGGNRRHVASH